jgi:hypothetical protein
MTEIILYIIVGFAIGVLSGLVGLGGGLIFIPVFVLLFGLTQLQAQGTTLALMVPPIGLLAAWTYYRHGLVNLKMAAFVCAGFFIGGFFGAKVAVGTSNELLQKIFGVVLLAASVRMIFFK